MYKDAIKIIVQVINSDKTRVNINFKETFNLLKFHHLESFLYYANKMGIIELNLVEEDKLKKVYTKNLYKTSTQIEELISIKESLKKNNLLFLPLKGSVIRGIYPSVDMRTMADIDILVKEEDLKTINKIMSEIGYKALSKGGNHDVYTKPPFMNVEIHRAMIDESYEMSKYYNNIWDRIKTDKEEFYLSDEDLYIYIMAHAGKHYGNGGTGIRSVLDIYLLNKKYPKLDFVYMNKEFKKLGIGKFARNIKDLGECWFNNRPKSDVLKQMEEYIINSGVYGTIGHGIVSDFESSKDSKRKVALRKAFPTYKFMLKAFPSLKYLPFMLPFYYIYRIVRGVFRGEVQKQVKSLNKVSKEDIENKKQIIEGMSDKNEN